MRTQSFLSEMLKRALRLFQWVAILRDRLQFLTQLVTIHINKQILYPWVSPKILIEKLPSDMLL